MTTSELDPGALADLIADELRATPGVVRLHPNPRAVLRGLARKALGDGETVEVDLRVVNGRAIVNADVVVAAGRVPIEVVAEAQRRAAAALGATARELEVDVCITAREQ
ncbi:hypothetical protein [Naumannella huperziae]